jgi:hypothetical protein
LWWAIRAEDGRGPQTAPRATVRVIDVPPIAGAALLGLDRAGAGPAAQARLRAAYSPAAPPAPPVRAERSG